MNKQSIKIKFSLLLITGVVGIFCFGNKTLAAPDVVVKDEKAYATQFVSQSVADPITLEAGAGTTVVFKFKNVGTATWKAGGRYISAYTMEPKYHASQFIAPGWISDSQTNKITTDVKPGAVGELKVNFIAPNKPGEYAERYYLAAEGYSWVRGGYFFVKFKVLPAKVKSVVKAIASSTVQTTTTSIISSAYKAKRTLLNTKNITAVGGEQIKIILGFQNLGTNTWKSYKVSAGSAVLASVGIASASLSDTSWQDSSTVLSKQTPVGPDEYWRETFFVRAPAKAGTYQASLTVWADDQAVGVVDLPVTVTADAPNNYVEPTSSSVVVDTVVPRLAAEPRIRVGLWKPADKVVHFISFTDDYRIMDGETERGVLPQRKFGILRYENGMYSFEGGGLNFSSGNYLRLEPINNPHAVFTLNNYERKVTWKGPNNFNEYRGAMELRMTQDDTALYVINDLLLEDYVAGDAETSNGAPFEYIKAMQTAYRTYAYYIKEHTDKHDKRNFDVVANTGDQLYLGYISEKLMPRVAQAAVETRGQMITYNHEIVITPYYANSDGHTRSWTQVWGGSAKPWLVSVTAEYDQGRKMLGHGVGMSARDAAERADKEGTLWSELLKHYYTGVEIERIFN